LDYEIGKKGRMVGDSQIKKSFAYLGYSNNGTGF
jgi:hypothetical protein